jgi:hypothetical protein
LGIFDDSAAHGKGIEAEGNALGFGPFGDLFVGIVGLDDPLGELEKGGFKKGATEVCLHGLLEALVVVCEPQ